MQRLLSAHGVAAADLALMRAIDALHLEYSFAGSKRCPGGTFARAVSAPMFEAPEGFNI